MRFSPQLVRSARPEKPNRRKRFKPFYGARKLGLAHVRFGETSKCALPDFCETDSADPAYSFCTRQAPRLVPHFVGYQTACQGGALPPWTPDHLTTSFSILNLVHLFQNLFTGRFLKMHGGKREGAGRKSSGKKKIVMYGTAAEEAMLRKALEEFRQKPKLNAKNKMPWIQNAPLWKNDC